jgi:hypothetical protein
MSTIYEITAKLAEELRVCHEEKVKLQETIHSLSLEVETLQSNEKMIVKDLTDIVNRVKDIKERRTMKDHFNHLLDRIDIDSKMIGEILDKKLALAVGPMLTQAVLGEVWKDCIRLDLVDLCVNPAEARIARILRAGGYECVASGGDSRIPVPYRIHGPETDRDLCTIMIYQKKGSPSIIAVHISQPVGWRHPLDFCDITYDGQSFAVKNLNAVQKRQHFVTRVRPIDITSLIVYKQRGFNATYQQFEVVMKSFDNSQIVMSK